MAWQDVVFSGGLYTQQRPASAPQGTLAECTNADVTEGGVRSRAGLVLLGTPDGLSATPVVKAVGWGQHNGIQEILYAVTDDTGGITVFKWSPGDTAPIALSGSLDIDAQVTISHGAFGKHIYAAVSKDNRTSWYRHEVGKVPPDPEAFKLVRATSNVTPPGSMEYEWDSSLPRYRPFGSASDGSSILYTPTGTAPTSVILNPTYVKVAYPTSSEPGSTLEVTVTLGGTKQFLIDFNDAMAMQFLVRNCTLDIRYIELETQGGRTWRGNIWGATQGGGYVGTSWVVFPVQQERREDRDTEKVVKVRFKFALATVNPSATPEIWIDSPLIGGTYLWNDPWMNVPDQPMKYAAQYIDNQGNVTGFGAITEVPGPEPGTWAASIGGHLKLTPEPSNDPLMVGGSIVIWRALRFDSDREERWFKMATIANDPASPQTAVDKYLPREHARNPEGGIDDSTLPIEGTVRAIAPHQERLFIGIDNKIWASAMGTPEKHVVDVGFDPLAPTAPEKHFASADQSAYVTGFASGDALLVCTDKGAYLEFGWPDQLSFQRVKVFDDPCPAVVPAIEAMGSAIFTSPLGAYGVGKDGGVQEISDAIRRDLGSYNAAWHRGEVFLVNGTSLLRLARTGAWHEATLGKSIYAMYGGFSNLDYILAVGNDGSLYALDPTATTDAGQPITWRVVTNMAKVPDSVPREVRYSHSGTEPVIKLLVPGRGEVTVATYNQAGFTSQDFNGLGLQVVVEGAQDTVLDILQVRWEPEGDRPMQP